REYLGGILSELIDGLQVSVMPAGSKDSWLPSLPDPAELREIVERARAGQLLRITLGEDRWQLVERMQAAMSLIEGHAEHTMDVIGGEVLPSLERLRSAMNRRRENRGLPALARAWRSPEMLPTPEELERPLDWVTRTAGAERALPANSGGTHVPPV